MYIYIYIFFLEFDVCKKLQKGFAKILFLPCSVSEGAEDHQVGICLHI